MPSKRIIVISVVALVICGIFGWFSFSALYVSRVLIKNADDFMRDLQSVDHKPAYAGVSTEMQVAMSKSNFVEQFAVRKITDWHFDNSVSITDTLIGDMTIDGIHYKIALKIVGSDTGLLLGGYDFGEFGRGGDIPIS